MTISSTQKKFGEVWPSSFLVMQVSRPTDRRVDMAAKYKSSLFSDITVETWSTWIPPSCFPSSVQSATSHNSSSKGLQRHSYTTWALRPLTGHAQVTSLLKVQTLRTRAAMWRSIHTGCGALRCVALPCGAQRNAPHPVWTNLDHSSRGAVTSNFCIVALYWVQKVPCIFAARPKHEQPGVPTTGVMEISRVTLVVAGRGGPVDSIASHAPESFKCFLKWHVLCRKEYALSFGRHLYRDGENARFHRYCATNHYRGKYFFFHLEDEAKLNAIFRRLIY